MSKEFNAFAMAQRQFDAVADKLQLDDGAVSALLGGNSLLPVGIVKVRGRFRRGDVVSLLDLAGAELGRGLAEYSDEEARLIAGCQSEAIEDKLGYRGRAMV